MEQIQQGSFPIHNPFTRTVRKINLKAENIQTIVFWSKNFAPLIHSNAGRHLKSLGFDLYFNFTINSESALLEPGVPPLADRLEQLTHLASQFGPQHISWRFDPICFFRTALQSPVQHNLDGFESIAAHAADLGIKKCVTSFYDDYPKIQKRIQRLAVKNASIACFVPVSSHKKRQIIQQMETQLAKTDIRLFLCCEKETFELLGPDTSVMENACIDSRALNQAFGRNNDTQRDYGQRSKQGCRCTRSIDVGSYADHPCRHNCLFCYAHPEMDLTLNRQKRNTE